MWDDNWHPDGPFSSIDAKLSSVILNMAYNWSNARSDDLVTILSKLPWIAIGECDKAVWISSELSIFSISSSWYQIRLRRPTVNW